MSHPSGPLSGLRVLEFSGIGPGPHVAMLLAEGWRPGHEALLVAAVDTFGWAADRRRVQSFVVSVNAAE